MNTWMRAITALALVALLGACASHPPAYTPAADADAAHPALLLISIDGLRPSDITPEQMPRLSALAANGVIASDGMRPSYPSLTFPNHYTLVTGLRPDRHGIVHNSMEDAELGSFRLSRREAVEDARWWGGKPVWVSAESAGLRTATMYWPGSEAAIAGVRPRTWLTFDQDTSAQWRAEQVRGWMLGPAAERPAFATLYFDKVDHESHSHGPASAQARAARADTDAAIGQLLDALQATGELDRVNILVVSDHGMADVPPTNLVAVEDMVAAENARHTTLGQVVGFAPVAGRETQARQQLLGRHDHYQCWDKAELPAQWHYGRHARIPPIICQMDEGWDALRREWIDNAKAEGRGMRGSHGYDPALPSMRASFIAHGPAFRPGTRLPVFDNVDVYPLMMRLLGVAPEAHDGDPHTFDAVLQPGH